MIRLDFAINSLLMDVGEVCSENNSENLVEKKEEGKTIFLFFRRHSWSCDTQSRAKPNESNGKRKLNKSGRGPKGWSPNWEHCQGRDGPGDARRLVTSTAPYICSPFFSAGHQPHSFCVRKRKGVFHQLMSGRLELLVLVCIGRWKR